MDLHDEVSAELSRQFQSAHACGLPPWMLIADPGIGFAKSHAHNLSMLRELPRFVQRFAGGKECLGGATLVGTSRKGFIGKVACPHRPWFIPITRPTPGVVHVSANPLPSPVSSGALLNPAMNQACLNFTCSAT